MNEWRLREASGGISRSTDTLPRWPSRRGLLNTWPKTRSSGCVDGSADSRRVPWAHAHHETWAPKGALTACKPWSRAGAMHLRFHVVTGQRPLSVPRASTLAFCLWSLLLSPEPWWGGPREGRREARMPGGGGKVGSPRWVAQAANQGPKSPARARWRPQKTAQGAPAQVGRDDKVPARRPLGRPRRHMWRRPPRGPSCSGCLSRFLRPPEENPQRVTRAPQQQARPRRVLAPHGAFFEPQRAEGEARLSGKAALVEQQCHQAECF